MKNVLRTETLRERDKLTEEYRMEQSENIRQKIILLEEYRNADYILNYCAFRSEVDLSKINEEEAGKRLFLPKVTDHKAGIMEFYKVNDLSYLQRGYMNIPEPTGDTEIFNLEALEGKKCFMILPGAVFDLLGYRIGYGGGFYDRYLSRCRRNHVDVTTVGVCFAKQIVMEVPKDPWDRQVDILISEKGVFHENGK